MRNTMHFMPINSPVFNYEFIKLINEYHDGQNLHQFIISDEVTYKRLSKVYTNIEFVQKITLKLIDDSSKRYKTVFFHSLFIGDLKILCLKKEIIKKIIWCVWGHDLYRKLLWNGFKNLIYNLSIAVFVRFFARKKLKKLKAIVAGFDGDLYRIKRLFGENVPVLSASYPSGYYIEDINRIIKKAPIRSDGQTRIMIGHSGFRFLSHKKYLKLLLKYKNENIKIILILSYGDKKYIDNIIAYSNDLYNKGQLEIITDFLPYDQYIQLINSIDLAIFDFKRQAALGNIFLLSYLKKRIYLSQKCPIYKEFMNNDMSVFDCKEVGTIAYESLRLKPNNNNVSYLYKFLDLNNINKQWESVFNQ